MTVVTVRKHCTIYKNKTDFIYSDGNTGFRQQSREEKQDLRNEKNNNNTPSLAIKNFTYYIPVPNFLPFYFTRRNLGASQH